MYGGDKRSVILLLPWTLVTCTGLVHVVVGRVRGGLGDVLVREVGGGVGDVVDEDSTDCRLGVDHTRHSNDVIVQRTRLDETLAGELRRPYNRNMSRSRSRLTRNQVLGLIASVIKQKRGRVAYHSQCITVSCFMTVRNVPFICKLSGCTRLS